MRQVGNQTLISQTNASHTPYLMPDTPYLIPHTSYLIPLLFPQLPKTPNKRKN